METIALGVVLVWLLSSRGRSTDAAPEQRRAEPEPLPKQVKDPGIKELIERGAELGSLLVPLGIGGAGAAGGAGAGGAGAGAAGGAGAGGTGGGGAGATGATVGAGASLTGAFTAGAVIAAALPVAYIIGFIVAGEIAKAQEAAKNLQSLLISKTPNARGLNWFESMLLKAELDRWGVRYLERLYRDPRMDMYVQGSAVVVRFDRTQLLDVTGVGAPGSSSSDDYPLVFRYGSKAVQRARQAALEFLSWRGFWVGRIARVWPGAPRLADPRAFDVPPGPSYDYLEPGLGGLERVPDPFGGPRVWPGDPQGAAPSLAELTPSGNAVVAGADASPGVLAFARLAALIEALALAKRIWPQDDAAALAQRIAGAQESSSILLTVDGDGWRLRGSFWGPFEGSRLPLSLAWTGDAQVALVPEAQRDLPVSDVQVTVTNVDLRTLTDVRKGKARA